MKEFAELLCDHGIHRRGDARERNDESGRVERAPEVARSYLREDLRFVAIRDGVPKVD